MKTGLCNGYCNFLLIRYHYPSLCGFCLLSIVFFLQVSALMLLLSRKIKLKKNVPLLFGRLENDKDKSFDSNSKTLILSHD